MFLYNQAITKQPGCLVDDIRAAMDINIRKFGQKSASIFQFRYLLNSRINKIS